MNKVVLLILAILTSCGDSDNKGERFTSTETRKSDERVAIIHDEITKNWFSKNGYTHFEPTKKDFIDTENILKSALKNGLFDFLEKPTLISIKKYYRQYTCYLNEKNQKVIRINAFCQNLVSPVEIDGKIVWQPYDWKNDFLVVHDGGKCYWTAIVNLSTNELINIYVNGEA